MARRIGGQKDVAEHIRWLKKRGYDIVPNQGHFRIMRRGVLVTTMPSSPSDQRWRKNATADILRFERQAGGG